MPISIETPITVTIDKIMIDEFTIRPQDGTVVIHFSKGYEDPSGNFVAKQYDSVTLKNITFDPTLYEQVKDALYSLLSSELSTRAGS